MYYIRSSTVVYIDTYRGRMTGQMWWCRNGKTRAQGHSGKDKQIRMSYVRYVLDLSKFTKTHLYISKQTGRTSFGIQYIIQKNNSTVNIQNLEDDIATKRQNDNSNNHTNDEQKTNVDNDEILIAQIAHIYQLETNPTTKKHEANIVTKDNDKVHSYNSVESNTMSQQDHIIQYEYLSDGCISVDTYDLFKFLKRQIKNKLQISEYIKLQR